MIMITIGIAKYEGTHEHSVALNFDRYFVLPQPCYMASHLVHRDYFIILKFMVRSIDIMHHLLRRARFVNSVGLHEQLYRFAQ